MDKEKSGAAPDRTEGNKGFDLKEFDPEKFGVSDEWEFSWDEPESAEPEPAESEPAGKTKRAEKTKEAAGFPVGGLIVMLVLLAAVIVAGYFCVTYFGQFYALKSHYNAAFQEANEMLDTARAEYAEADPESEASAAERRRVTEEMIAEANGQIAEIEQHNAELDASVKEAESKIKKLEGLEDYEYYRAIYDKYVEGRAYVEKLLSDH